MLCFFSGRKGVLTAIMPQGKVNDMLVAKVPKKTSQSRGQFPTEPYQSVKKEDRQADASDKTLKWMFHDDMSTYESEPLTETTEKKVCQNGFCCNFKVDIADKDPNVFYRMMVFKVIKATKSTNKNIFYNI